MAHFKTASTKFKNEIEDSTGKVKENLNLLCVLEIKWQLFRGFSNIQSKKCGKKLHLKYLAQNEKKENHKNVAFQVFFKSCLSKTYPKIVRCAMCILLSIEENSDQRIKALVFMGMI